MPKTFYKTQRPCKLFYAPHLEYHSTAYGNGVLNGFLLWREQFYRKWNTKTENYLPSEFGDIGGAPIRCNSEGEFTSGIVRERTAKMIGSDSVLPALWAEDLLLEADRAGFFVVNGTRTQYNLGIDLKAWAIFDLFQRSGERELFVVGKPHAGAEPRMTEYRLARDGSLGILSEHPLDATAEPRGHLVCFGRHIFLVYGKTLSCYYMEPETGQPERVPLGGTGNGAALRARSAPVVDGRGNVFWISDHDVRTFRIGFPSDIRQVALPNAFSADTVCCRGNELYVFGTVRSEPSLALCREASGGSFEVTRIPVHAEIVLGADRDTVRYLSLEQRLGRSYAIASQWKGRGAQETSRADMGDARSMFYYFGDVVKDARYVGRNEKNETVRLK